jgi:hypothetical protein
VIIRTRISLIAVVLLAAFFQSAGPTILSAEDSPQMEDLSKAIESLQHRLDEIEKSIDDVTWFERVGEVAFIEKVRIVGPPRWKEPNPTAPGAGNPL